MKPFKSDGYIFRATTLGLALVAAGFTQSPQLIREPKREGLLKQRHDRSNSLPSVRIELNAPKESAPQKVA